MATVFDPQEWLVTLFRALEEYVSGRLAGINTENTGLEIYDLVFDDPSADSLPDPAEFTKTIIHFAIDDVNPKTLGFGDSAPSYEDVEPTEETAGTTTPRHAMQYEVNFDVGIWASDVSGGVTSRLKAYQWLDRFFSGPYARRQLLDATDGGIEIRSFMNGRFVKETINDVRVYRVVGAELVVRVFGYTLGDSDFIVDGIPILNPELEIAGDDGSPVPLTDES